MTANPKKPRTDYSPPPAAAYRGWVEKLLAATEGFKKPKLKAKKPKRRAKR